MDSRKLKNKTVHTEFIHNAKLFNVGIRRHAEAFRQPHFVENIVQSLLHSLRLKDAWVLVGGDGRSHSKDLTERLIQVLAGNAVRRVFVGLNGHIPTPVAPYLMKNKLCHFGFVITAGHHPAGGHLGYTGLKIISPPGIPARQEVIRKANRILDSLQSYSTCEKLTLEFKEVGKEEKIISGKNFTLEVIDVVSPYVDAIKTMFDFPSIKKFIADNDFKLLINCSNGVTGSTLKRIFAGELGVPLEGILNCETREDFGRLSPDPNPANFRDFINRLKEEEYHFGAVISPDGSRCMIIGNEGFVVSPSDSLAIVAAKNGCIPFFRKNKLGIVVRSICTSQAVDKVADSLSVLLFEVPAGWQNFGGAMLPARGGAILFGEESCGLGTSSDSFCGDRDGMWAALAWLSILSECNRNLKELAEEHWKTFGRSFFGRLDYRNVPHQQLDALLNFFQEKNSLRFEKIKSAVFGEVEFVDPFGIDTKLQTKEAKKDNSEIVFDIENYVYPYGFMKKSLLRDDRYQIYQISLTENARVVLRRSESMSSSSTLRLYVEYQVGPGDENLLRDREVVLEPFIKAAIKITKIEDFISSDTHPVFV